jgi:acetyl esterase
MTDPWQDLYPPDLAELIAWVGERTVVPGPFPPLAPAEGQSRAAWASEVAAVRARHDAAALRAGELTEQILPPAPESFAAVGTSWVTLPVADGAIGLRVYTPAAPGPHPAVLLVHGGAYWMGGGAAGWQLNDRLCRRLAAEAGAVVVNCDHRLAPEFPYPIPLEDTYAALVWTAAQAAGLGIDAERIAVFGISSGGNLACAAAQLALDRGGPKVAAQVLQCPSLDLSLGSSRYSPDGVDVEQAIDSARALVAMYAGGADPAQAPVSPGRREDLSQTPPTLLVAAQFDALAGDALGYGERLKEAGRPVTINVYPMTHTVATPEVFLGAHRDTVAWLRHELG